MPDEDSYEFDVPEELLPWIEHQRENDPKFPLEFFVLENGRIKKVKGIVAWAMWFEYADRQIDRTEVGKGYVSTVFLGIPHIGRDLSFDNLFETMVFETGTEWDERQRRYRTMGEAKTGHWEVVELVRKALG